VNATEKMPIYTMFSLLRAFGFAQKSNTVVNTNEFVFALTYEQVNLHDAF
jgi:hypothetical protein